MIAFLALAAAAPAATPPANSDPQSLRALHVIGACVADRLPWDARAVLALDYRTPEYADKLKTIGDRAGRCVRTNAQLRSSGVLFAGALAEAMLKTHVKQKDLASRLAFDPARPAIEARSAGEEMTLCTALHAPKATAALFETRPATREEGEAENLLAPVMGECLQKDTKVEMNRPAIRAMLALAAYRIVNAPKKAAQ
jgi:hypothetical protein